MGSGCVASDWLDLARRLARGPDDAEALAALAAPPPWPRAEPPPDPPGLVAAAAAEPPAAWHARHLVECRDTPIWRSYHARWLWYLLAPQESASWPRVSVVIATFDRADTVVEAVESVLAQDYPALELIVVDDASRDDTLARLAAFAGRIRLLPQAQNGGVATARNAGLAAASGEMVQFLDSDDLLLPGCLRQKIAAFAARPAAGLCFNELEHVDLASGAPRRRVNAIRPGAPDCATRVPEHALVSRFFLGPSCLMLPRPLIEEIGRFDQRLRRHEDRLLYGLLGLAGARCIILDRPLVRVRAQATSLSRTADQQLDAVLVGLLLLNGLLPHPELWWLARDLLPMLHWHGSWAALHRRPADDPRLAEFERLLAALEALAAGQLAPERSPRPLAADLAAGLAEIRVREAAAGPLSERLDAALAHCAAGRAAGPQDLADWRRCLEPARLGAAFRLLFAALGRDLRRGRPWVPIATLGGRPFRALPHPGQGALAPAGADRPRPGRSPGAGTGAAARLSLSRP